MASGRGVAGIHEGRRRLHARLAHRHAADGRLFGPEGVYALWNGAAMVLIALSSLVLISLEDPLALVGVGMGALVTLPFMLVLTVAMVWGLFYLARRRQE